MVNLNSRSLGYIVLFLFFLLFVLFLYGPIIAIIILSFQGPNGGLTFPMNGFSLHWFGDLFKEQRVGDFKGSFSRSIGLAFIVMLFTVIISLAAGLAYRKGFRFSGVVFYGTIASLIVPSILITIGIGLMFDQIGLEAKWYTSGMGAHLTWTLPFGLLIMFAVFNRFDKSFEESGRDLGASPWLVIWFIVVPIIGPSLIGIGLFGFTLSFDEFARSLLAIGSKNTLPLEVFGMTTTVTTPTLYALGSLTTGVSFLIIGLSISAIMYIQKKRGRHGDDSGQGMI
ncbi:MAG: ABC transporter permease [Rhodospirillaceae bacterium]|nr:ABC transporter permease [Rhodospirillaceae bacterium]